MPSEALKNLVIDASVARAAGGPEVIHPTSKRCRDFLKAVLAICHRVVLTPEIGDEWKRHSSSSTRKWRVSMFARRKVVSPDPDPSHDELYAKIKCAATSEKDREAMEKDFCLIEAALDTDRIVVSLDETAGELFAQASQRVRELRNVVWVNPAKVGEQPISWLEKGAPVERDRQLGSWAGEEQ